MIDDQLKGQDEDDCTHRVAFLLNGDFLSDNENDDNDYDDDDNGNKYDIDSDKDDDNKKP